MSIEDKAREIAEAACGEWAQRTVFPKPLDAAPAMQVLVWDRLKSIITEHIAVALREARQQEREMVEGEIVAALRKRARYAEEHDLPTHCWAWNAVADEIERGDWKHSAGTGE